MMEKSAIVIGAGIVGLAVARALAIKGYRVTVFERSHKAVGASIRNFGMIWPIGQPSGKLYEYAIRSRNIWREIGNEGAFWYGTEGSLHVAHQPDEWIVLQELFDVFHKERAVELLAPAQIAIRSEAVVQNNLSGGLYSAEELIVDPRESIDALPGYLHERYLIDFYWGKCIHSVTKNAVHIGKDETHQADIIFVCGGTDLETLYPEAYTQHNLTKCKLQMMRLASQPDDWKIGPALCAGLSLIHYDSFKAAPSLTSLKERFAKEMKEYLNWGIHVMVAQNGRGELTIGDSHEYSGTHDPFDKHFINKMVINYLKNFAQFKDWSVTENWNGRYTKTTNGEPYIFFSPEPGVYILNAVGGAGMTLSFGLAEDVVSAM